MGIAEKGDYMEYIIMAAIVGAILCLLFLYVGFWLGCRYTSRRAAHDLEVINASLSAHTGKLSKADSTTLEDNIKSHFEHR